MEEKIFNLLETMYGDLTSRMDHMESSFTDRMDHMESNFTSRMNHMESNFTSRMDRMENGLKDLNHNMIRLENKMDANHKALYDGYQLTYEKLESLEERVANIESRVEQQDVEIRVIRGVK